MRILPLVVLLSACSPQATQEPAGRSLYVGEGRDRLCRAGDRVGFITYGEGDANCSVRGRVDRAGEQLLAIFPDGDQDCRMELYEQGNSLRLGKVAATCAYYCGPDASFEGRAFTESSSASPAVDFAGDPLC
jgi:hypothetical protein